MRQMALCFALSRLTATATALTVPVLENWSFYKVVSPDDPVLDSGESFARGNLSPI
jgi:hypothetical protein